MTPSDRIRVISEISNKLDSAEWSLIDLTLRQFGLPYVEDWPGDKTNYIIEMIQEGNDECLLELASHLGVPYATNPREIALTKDEIQDLLQDVEQQTQAMIDVSTGGQRIQEINAAYKERRISILSKLKKTSLKDPNSFSDLWKWYRKWSDGSLPTYKSRREYVIDLYQQLTDNLIELLQQSEPQPVVEPTGWARVDRSTNKILKDLDNAANEEDYQTIGLLCREVIISLAQAVYEPDKHPSLDGVAPSETDAKRMLENYIATQLSGGSNEALRKYTKDTYKLAVVLQHKRSATYREAALCVEATRALANSIAIISGQRDQ